MTIQKIQAIRDHLTNQFMEREEIVEGLLIALLARQHVLLVGPPGTAKSALVNGIIDCISGNKHFQWLLTKFTTPEEVFGPISLKSLENDVYERIVTGKLPEANTFFGDEIFKSNSAILNAFLTIMNERKFYNDGNILDVPLHTIFGASNEYPQDESLGALFDRFLLRHEVAYLGEDSNFASLLKGSLGKQGPQIDLQELEALQQQVSQVAIPDEVIDIIVKLRRELKNEGIEASDRRWKQSLSLLQAKALLEGRNAVSAEDDLLVLAHSLWNEPHQRNGVRSIVNKQCDPLSGRIDDIILEAKDAARPAIDSQDERKGTEAIKKLKALRAELDTIMQGGSGARKTKAEKAKELVSNLNKEVLDKCLGI